MVLGSKKRYKVPIDRHSSTVVEDCGKGRPIIFLHGVLMSRKFFQNQIEHFAKDYRAITFDLPGHGDADDPQRNHTVPEYAKVLNRLIVKKNLTDALLVGWSMGAFIAWQYLMDFGSADISGVVVVDETPTDLKRDDYPHAPLDLTALQHFIELTQTNYEEVADTFMSLMFKNELRSKEKRALHAEIMKVTPTTASSILFDQTLRDYRDKLSILGKVPHHLCFGRDEKLVSVAAAKDLQSRIPNATLTIFNESGHCPFLEEPNVFNSDVDRFIASL